MGDSPWLDAQSEIFLNLYGIIEQTDPFAFECEAIPPNASYKRSKALLFLGRDTESG